VDQLLGWKMDTRGAGGGGVEGTKQRRSGGIIARAWGFSKRQNWGESERREKITSRKYSLSKDKKRAWGRRPGTPNFGGAVRLIGHELQGESFEGAGTPWKGGRKKQGGG